MSLPYAAATGAARIRRAFRNAGRARRAALVPYLVAGRPSVDRCVELVGELAVAGAALIELGVPFSDPLADGEVIRNATRAALDDGIDVAACVDIVRRVRRNGVDVPIVLMGYVNPLLAYGIDEFCSDAADAAIDGLIVPDAQGYDELQACAASHGLGTTMLVTPLSSDERIAELAERSSGFLYAVAATGTTGERTDVADTTVQLLDRARAIAGDVPVAVGFGVSTPDHVARLAPHADGVIVGSALVDLVERDVDSVPARVRDMVDAATH